MRKRNTCSNMVFGCDCCCVSSFVYIVGLFTIASKVLPFLHKKFFKKPVELQEKNFKKDVVYLYQFPGTPTCSSLSPFCIKVEAYCRLHNLKFERRNTYSLRGSNGLLPFIELNGEQIADSQIIVKRLTQIFKLKAYPDEQTTALGHAVDRMFENHTFKLMLRTRVAVLDKLLAFVAAPKVPAFLLPIIAPLGGYFAGNMLTGRIASSIGKFTDAEYDEMLKNDLTQLQTILGKKKFLVADEPTAVDCTAFSHFGTFYYALPSARNNLHSLLDSSKFSVLKEYVVRCQERLFGNEFRDSQ
ncbi:hypothetical protein PFISCL1PPCAC_12917 [Pristionchus fissidentatus]|uniref:Glutathione S-transferase n=1 Tax=Pristionchus fissidentatus TaxID=1538716 RepID=A0AAV5VQ06_9BILA|nr:hypothetical protein PFISCL1PPCAC_12917 [Pristionchus fissidentatus]